jgi:hypothetical protein
VDVGTERDTTAQDRRGVDTGRGRVRWEKRVEQRA